MSPDTIFALSSGRPPAAISVIRISGGAAHTAARAICGQLPAVRTAAVRELRDPGSGELLDQALVIRFDTPASATGEDIVEFQCHGGRAVVERIIAVLAARDDLREARAGEFTRRAFESGRIDLTEAEGLADLLEAETETQRKAALAMAEGGLRKQIDAWRDRLVTLSARAEAAIDYAEEDGVVGDPGLGAECVALADELRAWLDRPRVEPLRDGIRVVFAGPPNAGKSSLLNAIVGGERAIVSDIPGTTRDHIEVPLALSGLPILLTDTAGLRDVADPVEATGVERARALVESADVLVWLGLPGEIPRHPRAICVHARADELGRKTIPDGSFPTSTVTGQGITQLLERIGELARSFVPPDGAPALNVRQATHLQEAYIALRQAAHERDFVLQAEGLRVSRETFDRITGRAGVEDVLDSLFGRFCLGK